MATYDEQGNRVARYTDAERRAMAERKRAAQAGLYWGYDLASQGYRNAPELGKHMYTMYGQGNDPGYYGRNFIGASQNYEYNWNTGMKRNHAAPNNPDFGKWVPIEAWEMKRHQTMANAMRANPNLRTAEDFALWRRRNAKSDVPRDATGRAMDAPLPGSEETDPDSDTTAGDDPIDDVSTLRNGNMNGGRGLANLLTPPGPATPMDNYMHVVRGSRKGFAPVGTQLADRSIPGTGDGSYQGGPINPSMGQALGGRPPVSAPVQTALGGVTNQTRRPGGAPRPPYSHYPNGVPRPGMDTYPIPGQTYNPSGSPSTFDDYWGNFKRWWMDR